MFSISSLALYVIIAAPVLFLFCWLERRNRCNGPPFPPGPKPLPLIGNVFDMPKEKAWETYRKWNEHYGDVVYVEVLGSKIIILSSTTVINELLERRSAISSDRTSTIMASELMGFDFGTVAMSYGDAWRTSRRLMHTYLNQNAAQIYQPTQMASARQFVREILKSKQEIGMVSDLARANFGRMMAKMLYGIETEKDVREHLSIAEKGLEAFKIGFTPGNFLVDVLPFLKYIPAWFPGAGFKRYAQETRTNLRCLREHPILFVKASMVDGTALSSVAHAMLENDASLSSEKSEIHYITDTTASLYLASYDTTAATIVSFFLAMLVYPDVQRKAQAEINRVVGKERLPDMNDRPQLPYIQGIVNECLRWLPVTPLAVPHTTTRDDVYGGYFIPKGTIIIGNAWAILHNPEDYPKPETFDPSRYLTPDGTLNPSVRDPRTVCFGFGRRICPGRYVADASLFAIFSTLLATVDIVRAKDADGKEVVPEVGMTSEIISNTKPFPWTARPRSQHAEELLAHALDTIL